MLIWQRGAPFIWMKDVFWSSFWRPPVSKLFRKKIMSNSRKLFPPFLLLQKWKVRIYGFNKTLKMLRLSLPLGKGGGDNRPICRRRLTTRRWALINWHVNKKWGEQNGFEKKTIKLQEVQCERLKGSRLGNTVYLLQEVKLTWSHHEADSNTKLLRSCITVIFGVKINEIYPNLSVTFRSKRIL